MMDLNNATNSCENNILITYNCISGEFDYHLGIHQLYGEYNNRPLWEIIKEDKVASPEVAEHIQLKISEISKLEDCFFKSEMYYLKGADGKKKWYQTCYICSKPGKEITIVLKDVCNELCDKLTGLPNLNAFIERADVVLEKNRQAAKQGEYAVVYFDIQRFKVINDLYGMEGGDRFLIYLGEVITNSVGENGFGCRVGSDRFAIFVKNHNNFAEKLIEQLLEEISQYDISVDITFNAGIYVTNDEKISCGAMIDRAILAQSVIKGNYSIKYNYYDEAFRKNMLSEQEIVGLMATALEKEQFVVYFQPQYNHSTGMLVGAEALVRWIHPERGMVSPGVFIPIFEKSGFIANLDLYVFEKVCVFIRMCIDEKLPVVPISTNFSRHDVYYPDFVNKLEEIRKKYNIPVKYLRVEITESVIVGSVEYVNKIIEQLHKSGYVVEMDDFGSGYSSLNVLKDMDLDILKLDMRFLSDNTIGSKGGTIVSSVVRMAKWLSMPIIAEGVETIDQADFLRSIGCDYIQGFLYSRPLPQEKYLELLNGSFIGATIPQLKLIETMNAFDFWNPSSMETLIFNNYVGGAFIFHYTKGTVEILRVNKKYLKEIGMNFSEKEMIKADFFAGFDEKNKKLYLDMLDKAIETGEEQECETWQDIHSQCCGDDRFCIRTNVCMIGKSGDSYLFYATIRNITNEKNYYNDILANEKCFKMASEQANVYFWEYTIATREMRPCFRCMRDLGLPPLVRNYPDAVFEAGIFPEEVREMYTDWHKQMAEGATGFEAVIPLTADRVPFRVRYTTEFDENGRPIKAYGSATLVVE